MRISLLLCQVCRWLHVFSPSSSRSIFFCACRCSDVFADFCSLLVFAFFTNTHIIPWHYRICLFNSLNKPNSHPFVEVIPSNLRPLFSVSAGLATQRYNVWRIRGTSYPQSIARHSRWAVLKEMFIRFNVSLGVPSLCVSVRTVQRWTARSKSGFESQLSHCDVRCMRHFTLTVLFQVIISFANLVLSTELMK